jgi:hypothetical protein
MMDNAIVFLDTQERFGYRVVTTHQHPSPSPAGGKWTTFGRIEEVAAFRYMNDANAYVEWLNTREEDKT